MEKQEGLNIQKALTQDINDGIETITGDAFVKGDLNQVEDKRFDVSYMVENNVFQLPVKEHGSQNNAKS